MANTIKPYDPKAICAKCGSDDVLTRHSRFCRDFFHLGRTTHCFLGEEHQHRYCRKCGYDWPEACLGFSISAQEGLSDG